MMPQMPQGLGGMLPMPNMQPQQPGMPPQGPVPPPGMGAPPASGPDAAKIIMAFLSGLSPDEQKGAIFGVGMNEMLKKMDLGKSKRLGADGQAGPSMQPGGGSGIGGNASAPLAPSNRPLGAF